MFAAYRDTGYSIVLFLHIATIIIALAGAVAHPLLFNLERRRADGDIAALAQRIEVPSRIYSIAYVVAGIVGFGLVSMGELPWGDAWLWVSILLWVASTGVLHGALLPAERALARGDEAAWSKVDLFGKIITVMIVVTLFLMTVKPGSTAAL
ncbi:MAG: hypothetical protein CL424_16505 [Acidimicrobiaceae bacterium]|nr:hypothetical protein [Acidimicrobiaceae bacterium]